MQGRELGGAVALLLLVLGAGCDDTPPVALDEPTPPTPLAAAFNPDTTGTIAGRVVWDGPAPHASPFVSSPYPMAPPPRPPERARDNPNAPSLDPATGGVRDVVLFLRGIDPARSRPWDLAPVHVEMKDYCYAVRQSDATASRFGFLRRGDTVTMASADEPLYVLRAQGAAFFALPFPDPDRPCKRVLPRDGLVELTSNCGQFWMRAYLFVVEHPYHTRSGALGDFHLEQVPEGEYELVCWSPSWRVGRLERDSISQLPARLTFGPPAEVVRRIKVTRGRTAEATFTLSDEAFPK